MGLRGADSYMLHAGRFMPFPLLPPYLHRDWGKRACLEFLPLWPARPTQLFSPPILSRKETNRSPRLKFFLRANDNQKRSQIKFNRILNHSPTPWDAISPFSARGRQLTSWLSVMSATDDHVTDSLFPVTGVGVALRVTLDFRANANMASATFARVESYPISPSAWLPR